MLLGRHSCQTLAAMQDVEAFLERWASTRSLPHHFVKSIALECPWLDGRSEISEDLASELMSEALSRFGLQFEAGHFVESYNKHVRASGGIDDPTRGAAYAGMLDIVKRFGSEGSLEQQTDFWLVNDSLSTDRPCVIVFNPKFKFSDEVLEELVQEAARCPYYVDVVIGDEEGNILQSKKVPRRGG